MKYSFHSMLQMEEVFVASLRWLAQDFRKVHAALTAPIGGVLSPIVPERGSYRRVLISFTTLSYTLRLVLWLRVNGIKMTSRCLHMH